SWELARRAGGAILDSPLIEVVGLDAEQLAAAWREFARNAVALRRRIVHRDARPPGAPGVDARPALRRRGVRCRAVAIQARRPAPRREIATERGRVPERAGPVLVRRRQAGYADEMPRLIDAIGHKAKDFDDADAWDREQLAQMSIDERLRIAELLRRRAYGDHAPDVRESEFSS